MKKWILKLVILVIGIGVGYLLKSSLGKNLFDEQYYLVGFLSSAVLLLIIISVLIFKLNRTNKQLLFTSIFSFLLFFSVVVVSLNIIKLNKEYNSQNQLIEKNIDIQNKIGASILEIEKTKNISILLKQLNEELNLNEDRTLSESSINRIKQLSYSLYPFNFYSNDTLSEIKISPGRGQLLIGLCYLRIDSSTFSRLIQEVDFTYSLLKKVDFSGYNLSGINLDYADLSSTNLSGCKLKKARFYKANLEGSNLTYCNLDSAFFKMVNLEWADLSNSIMNAITLDGSNLKGANLSNSLMIDASMDWLNLMGTNFSNSNLTRADLRWSTINKTIFSNTILKDARLIHSKISESNFVNSKMDGVAVEENWFDLISKANVVGYKEVLANYEIIERDSELYWNLNFFLEKKN